MSKISSSQKITPFLWFDGQAEAAMKLYTAIFPNSEITNLQYWAAGSGFSTDWVMNGSMLLNGLQVYAFDAGPQFKFNEAISLFVSCADQAEVDHYWNTLTADGGSEQPCGWLKDRFGLSWQIVPAMLGERTRNGDPEKVSRMMQALMGMKKLDIAALEAAYGL